MNGSKICGKRHLAAHVAAKDILRLLSLATASLIFATLAWTTADAETVRYYGAAISPTSVTAGSTTSPFSLTITNCNGAGTCDGIHTTTSSQQMGSATVQVPAAFSVDSGSLSVSASAGKTWTASLSSGVVSLTASAGTQKLAPGQSLTLTLNATAGCTAGSYAWNTAAYQDVGIPVNTTTPYTLVGSQPSVMITGSCAPPSGFLQGQYCSYTQGGWGADPHGANVGQTLASNFSFVYPSGVTVGNPFSMTFQAASDVDAYLPSGGPAGQLTSNLVNPTSSSAGVFGGQVLALRLNLDFNDKGIIDGSQGSISSLVLTGTGTSLDGKTVAQILTAAETALGGGALPQGYTISTLNSLIDLLNQAFDNCVPSDWVQTHLTPGA